MGGRGGESQGSTIKMVVICVRLRINELQTSLPSISAGRPLTSAAPQTPYSSPGGQGGGVCAVAAAPGRLATGNPVDLLICRNAVRTEVAPISSYTGRTQ